MQAVVVDGPGAYGLSRIPDPVPGPADLVVAVRGAGLCGTDMHLLDGELPYDAFPVVPGHEFYGEVVAVGTELNPSRLGELVAVDPNLPCHTCTECRRGRTNLCMNYAALGITRNGACAEFVLVPDHVAYTLPDDVHHASAVLIEPLACALHGLDSLPRNPYDRYLVYGAGTMGLLMALLAADLSPEPVQVVEPNPSRRALAEQLGLQAVAGADELEPEDRWESVIDCTGAVGAIEDGVTRVRRGGFFQCFGVADQSDQVKLSPFEIYRNEITIVGSMAILNSFDRATRLAASWGDRLAPLVTHEFALDGYADAVRSFREGAGLKICVQPNEARG